MYLIQLVYEYKTYLNVQQNKSNLLNDFINKNIDKELKDKLICLIESYTDSISDTYYSEFKIYYKTGFKDGIDVITKQFWIQFNALLKIHKM